MNALNRKLIRDLFHMRGQVVAVAVVRDARRPGRGRAGAGPILSIPERRSPTLNDLHITSGRYVEAGKRDEVIVSWEKLRIVGVAISPEYVYEIGGGEMFPDSRRFGVMWMSRDALGPAFNMDGAFNDVALSLSPGANESEVIEGLDALPT